jgi:Leucine-rich repeat (LRR) protein
MKIKLLILLFLASFSTYAQTNLVPNGGFETWTNSTTLSDWTTKNNVTQNTSNFTEGSKSVQLSIANNTTKPEILAQVPMLAGKTYTVKFKYKYVNTNYNGQHPISLNISKTGSSTTLSSSTFATNNNWTVKETTFTPDQNLSYDLSISTATFDAAAFNVLIDAVQVYVQGTEQYTLIPDVNFENKLIALNLDDVADGKVLTININTVTNLDLSNLSITNLTGIEDFSALKSLKCSSNKLTSLDLSKNTALTTLDCYGNYNLSSINLTKNINLLTLDLFGTKLTSIDLSANINLDALSLSSGSLVNLDITKNVNLTNLNVTPGGYTPGLAGTGTLTSLDVSKNVKLKTLNCSHNKIETLDFTVNTLLENLSCGGNKVTSLNLSNNLAITNLNIFNSLLLESIDISKNTNIQTLDVSYSSLKTLDLSKNINLKDLNADANKLISLDLSKNIALTKFTCQNTKTLNDINLKNGKNTILTTTNLKLKSNLSLICILVDDVTYSNTNWLSSKDTVVDFSNTPCSTPAYTLIPNANFEKALIYLGIDAIEDGKVLTNRVAVVKELKLDSYYTNGYAIDDMTGIQDFRDLEILRLPPNGKIQNLAKLDVSNNLKLKELYFTGSKITSLDISKNVLLTSLECPSNKINNLDISQNLALKFLDVTGIGITTLDINKNTALTELSCNSNSLTSLDVSKNVLLTKLFCSYNNLSSLDISKNPALLYFSCATNKITAIDLSANVALKNLDVGENVLTSLDISKNKNLTQLECDSNKLNSLDVSQNTSMTYLNCVSNQISTLDVSNNTALGSLQCSTNLLTALDVSKNTTLTYLNCNSNKLTTLDLTKNINLNYLNCSQNNLSSLNLKNGKNSLLTNNNIYLTNNPNLSCISVDNVAYSNTSWVNRKDANAYYSPYDCSAITKIPDAIFEDKLIALGIDTDGKNGLVLNSSIKSVTSLNVSSSFITNLTGIEGFSALKNLYVSGNLLKKLNLSKNTALNTLDCSNNPTLTCIQVADVAVATNNWTTTKDAIANFNLDCGYFTLIPDTNFEAKLIALGVDNVIDGKVLTENIATLTTLKISNSSITDLTGIQNFVSLETLECYSNKITTLDLSNNLALKFLYTNSNALTSLNVSKNVALEKLNCNWNNLQTLDLSKNIALKEIDCYNNKLTALNVTNAPLLTSLTCSYNEIASIDVSNNKSLTALYLTYNKLSNIDLSQNTLLTKLTCFGNNLTTLDLSKNVDLTSLSCGFNNLKQIDLSKNINLKSLSIENSYSIEKLDLSKNIKLEELYCYTSNFKYINLKNGNNTLLKNDKVKFKDNSRLSCIQVDNVTYSNTNWTQKDTTTNFNIECIYSLPSNNFVIETKGESCLGENNGEINIKATETLSYTASISGKNYPFINNKLAVTNLAPGTYPVSITVLGEVFEQNFNITIAKGATITGKSSIKAKTVSVEITEGTAPYSVFVDGIEQFETNTSSFSVRAKGGGLLEVKTAKACEGIYSKDISGLDIEVAAYPNPTLGSFEIELPPSNKKEVTIEINTLEGRIISSEIYTLENGTAKLTLENQPKGIYIAKIYLDTIKNVKIIKN